MNKAAFVLLAFIFLLAIPKNLRAQKSYTEAEIIQMQLHGTTQEKPQVQEQITNTQQQVQPAQTVAPVEQSQQDTSKESVNNDSFANESNQILKANNWFLGWWKIGFWVGILWLFPWIFVGWQWTKYKFWGFGWPWPWWYFLPLVWFIPWLIIAWQWWLVWWVWWVWIWWLFPWVFWVFWWIIIFKEAAIWHWHRRQS